MTTHLEEYEGKLRIIITPETFVDKLLISNLDVYSASWTIGDKDRMYALVDIPLARSGS
jgi:hypothetical protein